MNTAIGYQDSPLKVLLIFLRLGLTSFGGPIAHLGYFRDEFVTRRGWLTEQCYGDLVALCQFLPGPASSQVGMALGLVRAGYLGALAAWAGFTIPSAIILIMLGMGISGNAALIPVGLIHGLKIVAVAIVAQAVWGMARSLCPDRLRITIMTITTCFVLAEPSAWGQVGVMVAAGLTGVALLKPTHVVKHDPFPIKIGRQTGTAWILVFFIFLFGLPLLANIYPDQTLMIIDAFYRSGALVFGGGHVVLPLLQSELVPNGWIDNDTFLAGYGTAQAMPGPLFTFAAFLGSVMHSEHSGILGGFICLLSIFAPSFFLVMGALPFWEQLRQNLHAQAALPGVNAAVVGLLLAALYQPVWTSAIYEPRDFGLAIIAFVALIIWKFPPWFVVISSSLIGWLLKAI